MFNWFKKEVQTVEGILAGWLNAVRQLELHAADKAQEAAQHEITIAQATVAKEIAQVEATKAATIAEQLKSIVTVAAE